MKLLPPPYGLLKAIGIFLFKLYFRLECGGLENIPEKGGFIIAANHASYLDSLFIAATCPRKIGFMILESYYRNPVINWFCSTTFCIPVPERDSGSQTLKEAVEYLRAIKFLKGGNPLCIFPEGGRSPDGRLKEAKTGIAFVALKAGVPVIPAGIIGNFKAYSTHHSFPRPYKISIRYGKPIVFKKRTYTDREELKNATQVMMERIRQLME